MLSFRYQFHDDSLTFYDITPPIGTADKGTRFYARHSDVDFSDRMSEIQGAISLCLYKARQEYSELA